MNMSRRHAALGLAVAASGGLSACVSVGSSENAQPLLTLRLHDAAAAPTTRRPQPVVAALLIQPLPGDAQADTTSIAYSRRANEFAYYQLATWTERPVRQLPRLLQRRLDARGVAGAVGLLGDPLRADWLLSLAVDAIYHDVAAPPGVARLALSVELFDRRHRTRVAHRSFNTEAATARADSAAAAEAMSQAVAAAFDLLVPWLEHELQRAAAARP